MLDLKIDEVDILNPINNNLSRFVEAYVSVFGEKYRNQITTNLSSAVFLFPIVNTDFISKQILNESLSEIKNATDEQMVSQIKQKYNSLLSIITSNNEKQLEIKNKHKLIKNDFLKNILTDVATLNDVDQNKLRMDKLIEQYNVLLNIGIDKLNDRISFINSNKQQRLCLFFKTLGFKSQSSLQDYLNDPTVCSMLFDELIVNMFNDLQTNEQANLLSNDQLITPSIDALKGLNLYNYKTWLSTFVDYLLTNPETAAVVFDALNYDSNIINMCFFEIDGKNDLTNLIHEMGHIIDTTHKKLPGKRYLTKCGYRLYLNSVKDGTTKRININYLNNLSCKDMDYLMFNEVLNEYLAIKVEKEFQALGKKITIGNKPKDTFTTYILGFDILGDFFENHMEKLIEFKMSDNTKNIAKYFGSKNLAQLMKLTNEYVELQNQIVSHLKSINEPNKFREELIVKYKQLVDKIDQDIQKRNRKKQQVLCK